MTLRNFFKPIAFLAIVTFGSFTTGTASAGLFSIANLSLPSGTTPNGTSWSSLSTGTTPVAYFNIGTGELQIDPKGKPLNSFNFRYGSSTVTGTTAGPFVYTSGTGTSAVGTTVPAGTWTFAPTTVPANLAGAFYSLTSGSSSTNASSGSTYFDVPWSFGLVAPTPTGGGSWTNSLVYSSTLGEGFRSSTSGLTTGFTANWLGYGNGVGLFDYTVNGVTGKGLGAVIPVQVQAVPEPSTIVLAGLGAAAVGFTQIRRRRKMVNAAATAA